jgi:hypothetical protein
MITPMPLLQETTQTPLFTESMLMLMITSMPLDPLFLEIMQMPLPLFFKEYANSGSNNYANAPVPVHRDYANANDYVNAPAPVF